MSRQRQWTWRAEPHRDHRQGIDGGCLPISRNRIVDPQTLHNTGVHAAARPANPMLVNGIALYL